MKPEQFTQSNSGKVIKTIGGSWAFLPNPLPPKIEYTPALVKALAEAERAIGELRGISDEIPDPTILLRPFIRMEAVLSSRIEGTRATLEDIFNNEGAQLALFESGRDIKEVQNYIEALEYGLDRLTSLPISLRFIREIHAKLMQEVKGKDFRPGEFRTTQNFIGSAGMTLEDASYVPPPPEKMPKLLGQLESFLNQTSDIPELLKIGYIHYQFEAIHPFGDGNGRVGRLLIALLLNAWGILPRPVLNLSAYFEAQRDDYYNHLLMVSQRGEWLEWLTYFLAGVKQESKKSIQRIRGLAGLRGMYRELIKKERADERISQATDVFFSSPILSIRQLEKRLEIPYPAAERTMERLVELGIARELTGKVRNRVYQVDGILDLLNN